MCSPALFGFELWLGTVASIKATLDVFGEQGPLPGEIAHYISADARGGLIISENDTSRKLHANSLHYQQWMDFEIIPVQTIEDALPTIMAVYG